MSWLDFLFKPKKPASASVAKERLQVIFAHEKAKATSPEYLPKMQKEIMEVIAKYVDVDPDQVKVEFEQAGERSILELNVTLPDKESKPKTSKAKSSSAKKSKTKTATTG